MTPLSKTAADFCCGNSHGCERSQNVLRPLNKGTQTWIASAVRP